MYLPLALELLFFFLSTFSLLFYSPSNIYLNSLLFLILLGGHFTSINFLLITPFISLLNSSINVLSSYLLPLVFFLNQQFITWSARTDHGSYFITTYIHTDTTWGIGNKLENRKRKEKRRKKISVYMNAKALGLNCRKREKWDNKSLFRFQKLLNLQHS